MSSLDIVLRNEREEDAEPILRLHERAFGPGRFARTAYRLRESGPIVRDLCFVAAIQNMLAGAVRVSPIEIEGCRPVILGPLAVEPLFERRGIGSALMSAAIERARERGYDAMLLVGDAPFYGRFGFKAQPPGQILLPGPVDPARLLALALTAGGTVACRGLARSLSAPSPPA
jgi:predicted N-acetyltransferase YhbS